MESVIWRRKREGERERQREDRWGKAEGERRERERERERVIDCSTFSARLLRVGSQRYRGNEGGEGSTFTVIFSSELRRQRLFVGRCFGEALLQGNATAPSDAAKAFGVQHLNKLLSTRGVVLAGVVSGRTVWVLSPLLEISSDAAYSHQSFALTLCRSNFVILGSRR